MIATVMLYSLAIGAVLGVSVLTMDLLARRAGIAQRFVWFGALTVLVLLTLASPWRGTAADMAELPAASVVTNLVSSVAPVTFTFSVLVDRLVHVFSAPSDVLSSLIARGTVGIPAEVNTAIAALWLALSATLLSVLAFTLRRLDVQRRNLPRAELHGMHVRVGASRGPAVYGVLAPEIVVPTALLARSAEEQQLVLAHEDEHRRARDPLLLVLAATLVALLPWHPVAWWCASRIRLATELDCDARVLRRGTSPRRYGALLLAAADSMSTAPRVRHALALLDSRRHLERRILAMTTRPTRRTPLAMTALSLVGAAAVFAACSTDMPTAAQVRDADAQTVVRQLGLPSGSGQVLYFVDGVKMADAATVPAEQIASIEVLRKKAAGEVSEVHIRRIGADTTQQQRLPVVSLKASDSSGDVRGALAGVVIRSRIDEFSADREAQLQSGSSDTRSAILRKDQVINVTGDSVTFTARNKDGTSSVIRGVGSPAVVLRGSDSSAAEQPLIIVDGVISQDRAILKQLDPNRIESITILKGTAATELYGPQGANGVIQIKTKR